MEIIQPQQPSALHQQLAVLLPRYHEQDQRYQYLQSLYEREDATFAGEKSLAYYIRKGNLPDSLILYGLRLKEQHGHVATDVVMLTPTVCFLIEAKNTSGKISFNAAGQMIRTKNGSSEVYPDPMIQANAKANQLKNILQEAGYGALQIHPIVAFTHPKVTMLTGNNNPDILLAPDLVDRQNDVLESSQQTQEKQIKLRTLAEQLTSNHEPESVRVIEKYQIDQQLIRSGVFCPTCKDTRMKRVDDSWYCPTCKTEDPTAHINALHDYAILYKKTITKEEASKFLAVDVGQLSLEERLKTSGETYYLDSLLTEGK